MTNEVYLDISSVIEKLGNSQFSEAFLNFINQFVNLEHFSLVQLGLDEARFITSANVSGISISKSLQRMYLTRFFKMDPNIRFYNEALNNPHVMLTELMPQDIKDSSYQQFFGHDIKIVDRVSLLKHGDKGLYCINMYRFDSAFTESELDSLRTIAELLMVCAIKHSRLAGRLSDFLTRDEQIAELESTLHVLNDKLTERELAVCSRILLGFSGEGIALDLNVKVSSVQTYRKRAYAKLNISSQNELFGLCLCSD